MGLAMQEKLGTVTVSTQYLMIKDMENSQELTERVMASASLKLACRIFTPTFWPDSINRNHLELALPETLRVEADAITHYCQK
jgi:hypothetical protein